MIVQFKPVNMDKFTGKFDDKTVTIERHHNPDNQRSAWYVYVDGKRTNVKARSTPGQCIAVVETAASKVLRSKQQQHPVAVQGKPSPTGRKPSEPELQNIPVPGHKPGKHKPVFKTNLKVDYGKVEERVLAAHAAGKL